MKRLTWLTYLVSFLIAYVVIDLPALKRQRLIASGTRALAVPVAFNQEKNLRGRTVDWRVEALFTDSGGRPIVTNVSMASREYRAIAKAAEERQQSNAELGKKLSDATGLAVAARVVTQDDLPLDKGGLSFPIRYRPEDPQEAAYDYPSFFAHSNIVVMPIALGIFLTIYGVVWIVRKARGRAR